MVKNPLLLIEIRELENVSLQTHKTHYKVTNCYKNRTKRHNSLQIFTNLGLFQVIGKCQNAVTGLQHLVNRLEIVGAKY